MIILCVSFWEISVFAVDNISWFELEGWYGLIETIQKTPIILEMTKRTDNVHLVFKYIHVVLKYGQMKTGAANHTELEPYTNAPTRRPQKTIQTLGMDRTLRRINIYS